MKNIVGTFSKQPKNLDCEQFKALLLTFGSVEYADKFVDKAFPKLNYAEKFAMLRKYFDFNMIGGYVPSGQSTEETVKADYLFTLQHLLNKVKVVGIKKVVRSK